MSEKKFFFEVFTAHEYTTGQGRAKEKHTRWTRLGTGFPHNNSPGMNIVLNSLPIPDPNDGYVKLVVLPPREEEEDSAEQAQPAVTNPAELFRDPILADPGAFAGFQYNRFDDPDI
jgi:hypothetical protein